MAMAGRTSDVNKWQIQPLCPQYEDYCVCLSMLCDYCVAPENRLLAASELYSCQLIHLRTTLDIGVAAYWEFRGFYEL